MPPTRWLLLRGLVRQARHWGDFPNVLVARGLSPLLLDLPGVGLERHRTSPASIAGIVDDLRARFLPHAGGPWGIYAQSLGGMIALDWAARYPQDFERVVVTNTSANDLSPRRHRLSDFGLRTILRAVRTRDPVARERLVLDLVSASERGRAHAERFATYSVEAPLTYSVLVRQLYAAARSRSPAHAPVPVLFLASEGDRMVSPACSRALATRYGAPLHVHPTGGHDLPLDDPEWVADRLGGLQA